MFILISVSRYLRLPFVNLYSTLPCFIALKRILSFQPFKIKTLPCLTPFFASSQSLSDTLFRPVLFLTSFLQVLPLCARSDFAPLLPQDLRTQQTCSLPAASRVSPSLLNQRASRLRTPLKHPLLFPQPIASSLPSSAFSD